MDEQQLIYPVERLLANPRIFYAIANYLDGPDAETIKETFYELLEHNFQTQEDPAECSFDSEEVCFISRDGGGSFEIVLDVGLAANLQAVEGEIRAQISNDSEMAAASAIYQRLVLAIEESNPEFSGDIALCSPPTPGNSYLRSIDGDRFEGSFHLLSDPDRLYSFNVEVIDVNTDKLVATIQQIQ
jgi:hypothetical protein